VLAIIGSGETSPTMVTAHRALAARLHTPAATRAAGVLLDTPYAFQENAADVSARAKAYFARSVGLDVTVTGDTPGAAAAVRTADWVFSGPGSPSYALRRWRESGIAQALHDRVAAGDGITVMASAAAATIGCAALPVYEIYKAGADPHWLPGLDLMSLCGLRVAVIPHYDNAEGGTHDTRYCYLGERRLAELERELPAGTAVLGVDEHTAVIIDLDAGQAEITGRGTLTVRRAGRSTVFPRGTMLPLTDLRALVVHGTFGHGTVLHGAGASMFSSPRQPASQTAPAPDPPAPLPEITAAAVRRFDAGAVRLDATAMVTAILDLEEAISAWAADTEEDQGTVQARAVLRGLISRLGDIAARAAAADPGERLAALADPLLRLRSDLRAQGLYPAADRIRDALTAAGLRVHDTPDGTRWTLPR
jgi:cyanophycinase-like exopeptidase